MKSTVIAIALLVFFLLTSLAWGFNFEQGDGLSAGDVNGDGTDEIIYGSKTNDYIRIYKMDGTLLNTINLAFYEYDGLAAGDVNGDETDEIIHGDRYGDWIKTFDMDGNELNSISLNFEQGDGLTAGDVTGDGTDEIIYGSKTNDYIRIYKMDGTLLNTINLAFYEYDGLTAGDVNGDGIAEIIHGDRYGDWIKTFDMDGNELNSISLNFEQGDGLTAGDVTGDGTDEIIYGSKTNDYIRIYKMDGTLLNTINLAFYEYDGLTAGDVNGDGTDEIIHGDRYANDIRIFDRYGEEPFNFDLEFRTLDEAVAGGFVLTLAPVFDFDGNGCLPSAAINSAGQQNPGLAADICQSRTKGCRNPDFLNFSNTYHRHACTTKDGHQYCGHFYALYFKKDATPFPACLFGFGHRHDWEYTAIWTTDGVITHASYSAHGGLSTKPYSELQKKDGHVMFVYHHGVGEGTHSLRFANADDKANPENPYGSFVTPPVISWCRFTGDGISNEQMRDLLSSFSYGEANCPVISSIFWNKLSKKPESYPDFPVTEDCYGPAMPWIPLLLLYDLESLPLD